MKIKKISSAEDCALACQRISELMSCENPEDPELEELQILATSVEIYEAHTMPELTNGKGLISLTSADYLFGKLIEMNKENEKLKKEILQLNDTLKDQRETTIAYRNNSERLRKENARLHVLVGLNNG